MTSKDIPAAVAAIIQEVCRDGDNAIERFTKKFDGVSVPSARVSDAETAQAFDRIPDELRNSLEIASDQIRLFHTSQLRSANTFTNQGITIVERDVPIRRVGVYVPGGRFVYPSSVLMTVIPARVAGVTEIALCTPPNSDGNISDVTLAAAKIAGANEIYAIGGAQAIAALAYGTSTVNEVDLIVGPGNEFVNEAKRQVFGVVGIDSLAGPSEVVILLDRAESVDEALAAARAQCEHGLDSKSVIFVSNDEIPQTISQESTNQIEIKFVASVGEGIAGINALAPEHVEIYSNDADCLAKQVKNAGAIFCNTSAVLGDYIAGTNHVLPTSRAARFSNGLRVDTFMRRAPIVSGVPDEILRFAGEELALAEGLLNHAAVLASGTHS